MNSPRKTRFAAIAPVVVGLALGAGGIYGGETDDAPGAARLGLDVPAGSGALAVWTRRQKA